MRCGALRADFIHVYWACEKLVQCWIKIVNEINQFVEGSLPFTPQGCLLSDLGCGQMDIRVFDWAFVDCRSFAIGQEVEVGRVAL